MTHPVRIVGTNQQGGLSEWEVGSRGFGQVAIREGDPPPAGESNRYRFFSQLVSSDGEGGGTTNMNVNGSVTAQEFSVISNRDFDIRLMKLLIYIQDASVVHAEIGNIGALGTGLDVSFIDQGVETFLIQKAKAFGDLIRQTFMAAPFGSDASSFEVTNVSGTEDAIALPFNLFELIPGGLRIGMGSDDKLLVRVNDDMTGLTTFTVRAAGYRHYP